MIRSSVIWLAIVVAAILMASPFLMLAGCQGYQPPGEGIWVTVK